MTFPHPLIVTSESNAGAILCEPRGAGIRHILSFGDPLTGPPRGYHEHPARKLRIECDDIEREPSAGSWYIPPSFDQVREIVDFAGDSAAIDNAWPPRQIRRDEGAIAPEQLVPEPDDPPVRPRDRTCPEQVRDRLSLPAGAVVVGEDEQRRRSRPALAGHAVNEEGTVDTGGYAA